MKYQLFSKMRRFTGSHILLIIAAIALFTALSRYIAVYYSLLLFTVILVPLSFFSGGIVLFTMDTKLNRSFRVLLLLLLWTFLSSIINERRGESLLSNQADLGALAVLVFVCFPSGYLENHDLVQKFLKIAAAATVA